MRVSVRIRYLVTLAYFHGALLALAALFLTWGFRGEGPASWWLKLGAGIVVADAFFWYRVPVFRLWAQMTIGQFRCRRCFTVWPLHQWYRCTCSAVIERHIFKPCPNCHKVADMVICGKCQASELV